MFFIYTKPNCPFCTYATDLLTDMKIPFKCIDISQDEKALDFVKNVMNRKSVPFIMNSTETVGGYAELVAYLKKPSAPTAENIFDT